MKKYKVIALSVGGIGNKIFNSEDIVTEDNFKEGRAEELVKLKFLAPIEEKNKTEILIEEDNSKKKK